MSQRTITKVPLEAIDLGARRYVSSSAVDAMEADIVEQGLQFPVLLGPGNVLIDGRKRVEAFARFADEIPAVIAETFADAIDYLAEMNQGVDVSVGRMGQIIMAVRPLMLKAAYESRTRGRWRATDPPRPHSRARDAYLSAFPLSNSAVVARVTGLYMSAELNNNLEAKELVKEVESGAMTVGAAYARLYQRPFFKGDVFTRSAQESLLRNTTQHLSAVIKGLTKLKSPIKVRAEVAKECLEDLRQARATLISAIRELEKETEQA